MKKCCYTQRVSVTYIDDKEEKAGRWVAAVILRLIGPKASSQNIRSTRYFRVVVFHQKYDLYFLLSSLFRPTNLSSNCYTMPETAKTMTTPAQEPLPTKELSYGEPMNFIAIKRNN